MLIESLNFNFLYKLTYFLTTFLVILSALHVEIKKDLEKQKVIGEILVFIPAIFLIPLLGFRSVDVGTDTSNYYTILWLTNNEIDFNSEFMFTIVAEVTKYLGLPYSFFLLLTSSLFIYSICFFIKKISVIYRSNSFFVFFAYISMFFFLSLGINIIRQGVSLALLLVAYSFFVNRESKLKVIFFISFSLAFHSSSIIPLSIFVLVILSRKIVVIKDKYFYLIFVLFIGLSYLNFGLLDIAPTLMDFLGSDNRRASYLSGNDSEYKVGFRLGFVIFNTFFLIISMYAKSIITDKNFKDIYSSIVRYYIVASCLFFMAFQIPYSDRWGLFSWMVIPLIMSPLLYSTSVKSGIRIHWVVFLVLIFIGFNLYG